MNGFNSLVLAGRRDSENPFAEVQGDTHRALLDVVGVPMLVRVVRALRASASVDRIEVSIDDPGRFRSRRRTPRTRGAARSAATRACPSPSRSVQDALNDGALGRSGTRHHGRSRADDAEDHRSFRGVRRSIGRRSGCGSRGRIGASSRLPLDHSNLSAVSRWRLLGRQSLCVPIAASPARGRILGQSRGFPQATVAARTRLRANDLVALRVAPTQPRRSARARIPCDRLPDPRRAAPVRGSRDRRRSTVGSRPGIGDLVGARRNGELSARIRPATATPTRLFRQPTSTRSPSAQNRPESRS